MNTETVIERFIVDELLMEGAGVTINCDQSLISSGILDSLALLRLIAFLEDQFNITVDDGEVIPDNFQTINDIQAFVEHKTKVD